MIKGLGNIPYNTPTEKQETVIALIDEVLGVPFYGISRDAATEFIGKHLEDLKDKTRLIGEDRRHGWGSGNLDRERQDDRFGEAWMGDDW